MAAAIRCNHTVDGSEILHQVRLVVLSHYLQGFSTIQKVVQGFIPQNGWFIPQNGWFISWNTLSKCMMWGKKPYFWKHPYGNE